MTTQHTPLPWHVGETNKLVIYRQDGYAVADCKVFHSRPGSEREVAEANAALIVNAVNCHEELLSALKGLLEEYDLCGEGHDENRLRTARLILEKAGVA